MPRFLFSRLVQSVIVLWAVYPMIIPLTDRWECRNCGAAWPRFGTPPDPVVAS